MDNRIPLRTVRVPDAVWEHAKRCAATEGTSVSAHIVHALRTWQAATPQTPEPPDQPRA